jgi:hypothetical protein
MSPHHRGAARGGSERQACPTKRRARRRTGLRHVRDDLIWLGESDPYPIKQFGDADPRLEALAMKIEQWQAVLGQRRISAKES